MPSNHETPGHPIWDSNTDSVTIQVEDSASGSGVVAQQVVVPAQCYWMIFTASDAGSGGTETFYICTDAADVDGGIAVENGAGGQRNFSMAVTPGSTLYLSTDLGQDVPVTVTRFYNKP